MARRIEISLTKKSVDNAIKELRSYQTRVETIMKELVEELVNEGVIMARTYLETALPRAAIETGELLESIEGIFNSTTGQGFIKTDSDHAIYVELGTGIFVEGEAKAKYGDAGWWYYDEKQGRRRWTQGMPPRPFMWETYMYLCEKASFLMRTKYND